LPRRKDMAFQMDFYALRIFASLARTLNFSRTAEEYYLTQPAVSHHIKKLESSLRAKLVNRTSHDVSLTAEGEEFLPYAKRILDLADIAENRILNIAEGKFAHIRIAALSSTTTQLSDCLSEFYKTHPNTQVDIDLLDGADLISSIEHDKYDFYFAVDPMVPADNRFEKRVIFHDKLSLFVNSEKAAEIEMDDWQSIAKFPFVAVQPSDATLTRQVDQILRNRGCKPEIVNYYNRAEAVVLSVNAGIGSAILPGELGRLYQRPNVLTYPIKGRDAEILSVFVWHHSESIPACKHFRDTVLNVYIDKS